MNVSDLELMRHAAEKGAVLTALAQEYAREMVSVRSLYGALEITGTPMSMEGLQWALNYLADSGYVRIWRLKDLPTHRADRMMPGNVDTIVFAKLLPLGVQLMDGRAPADPGIRF